VGCAHRLHENDIGIHEVSYKRFWVQRFWVLGSGFSSAAGQKNGQSNRIKNLTKCNFIFLTPMEWDKKIPLGRQD
jgi:hypothetical protein